MKDVKRKKRQDKERYRIFVKDCISVQRDDMKLYKHRNISNTKCGRGYENY